MGLRVVIFTTAFNLLLWTSRATLGRAIEARHGPIVALAVVCLAPLALLLVARRLAPARSSAFAVVASLSLALVGAAA